MKNPTAYVFALLLLVQAMSAALYVVPNEEKQEEWQTTVFESSARSNNSSSPCGSNVNYTYTYAYAPYMVIENQSFTTSSYVYCEILNATMVLDYSIVDSNNSTVYSGNHSWTGSNTSNSNYTWNVSGLSAGYYTFNAELYVDGTSVDSDYDSFMVYANSSGSGGSGGGNYTSPCGSNASYASVYAYAPYMVMENQSFTTSTYVNCEVLNATMVLEYSIINSNNNTVSSGNQSWTGTSTTSSNYTWNVSGLSAGYYTFNAELYVGGTSVDSDYDSFMVYANSSGGGGSGGGNYTSPCGSNSNYTSVSAYAPYMVTENQSFATSVYVNCEILNATMLVDYWIYDTSNSTVYSGNQSWNGTSSSSSNFTSSVSGLSAGYYVFHADLYVDGSFVDSDADSFMVYANNSGGGGSGGGNYTSPCGSNVNYTYTYAYAPYMVMENQSFATSSYVYCEILNATMMLDYSIIDSSNSTVYSGNHSWTGSNTSSSNYTWNVSGLSAGYYTFNAELYVDGTFVDSDADSFMVYANTSGGGGSGGGNYTSPCGSNVNYAYTYAYAPYMVVENQSFTTSSYVYCEILNATMMLDYSIVDSNNSTVYSGNQSWTGTSTTSSNYTWNVSGLSAGYYVFHADLYVDGTFVDSDYDSFMVYANSSGGGGNNSGGGGNQTSPCGSNASYASVYAYAPYMVMENQSFTTSMYVNCEVLNATMMLEYSIINSNNNTVSSGYQSWTGLSITSSNYTWNLSGLYAGYYTFNAELYVDGTSVDSDYDSFMVYDNNSDTDGDGVLDSLDAFPMDANETSDYDGDGVGDNEDTDDDNDGVSDSADAFPTDSSETEDIDGDGVGNNADTDDDNDGVDDNLDEFPLDSSEAFDNDGDGVGDNADMDDDNDGVSDQEDAFPFDGGASNDADADGVADAYDNCITVFNPGQNDADLDGIGTECDADESTGNSGNNTGGETGGNNTGGETGGNTTDTSNWTECEVWEYFNQELIEETEPGNGCPFYEDTSEEDGAEEDTEGLPSVGFFATLTIVGLAIAFARQEKE